MTAGNAWIDSHRRTWDPTKCEPYQGCRSRCARSVEIAPRFHEIGSQSDCFAKMFCGVLPVALLEQQQPQLVVDFGRFWIEFQCAPEMRHGLFGPAAGRKRRPPRAMRFKGTLPQIHAVGVEDHRAFQVVDGLGYLLQRAQHACHFTVINGRLRIGCDCLLVTINRLIVLPSIRQRHPQCKLRLCVVWLDVDRLLKVGNGLIHLVESRIGHANVDVRRQVAVIDGQHFFVLLDGVDEPAAGLVRVSQIDVGSEIFAGDGNRAQTG